MIDFCACMGPMYGEPHCYCKMKELGLPLNETARAEYRDDLKAAFAKVFGWNEAESATQQANTEQSE